MTLTILYNNRSDNKDVTTAWGMACVIEGYDKTILFDTGGDGHVLLADMKKLAIDPKKIQIVVFSHNHWDHTGGLWKFLAINPHVCVYLPSSFPKSFKRRIKSKGATFVDVKEPVEICPQVYSTGQLGFMIKEQSLVLKTDDGLAIITGCSHPGVVEIAEKALHTFNDTLYLITGGFHLKSKNEHEIGAIIKKLKMMGVKKIGPSHCTGEKAIERFKDVWGEDFIEAGCGAKIVLPIRT